MDAIWWANFTASAVVLIPLAVTLVNAVRARHAVEDVRSLVNGAHSAQVDEIRALRAALLDAEGRPAIRTPWAPPRRPETPSSAPGALE